ncbi:MAG: hypothetical protein ACI9HK_003557 [Pirellulaceae bacterium]|jgi:hypothetical protein
MKTIKTLIAITALLATATAAMAGDCCCPSCGKTCQAEQVTIKTKHHCFEVECKDICIPSFRWPWEMAKKKCNAGCTAGCCDKGCTSAGCSSGVCCNKGCKGKCPDCPSQCDGCPPKCGTVKTVKVLKKKEYECEHCGYEWKVFSVGGGCADGCCNGGCEAGGTVVPQAAPESSIPEPPPASAERLTPFIRQASNYFSK